jgi:hypothetical protein
VFIFGDIAINWKMGMFLRQAKWKNKRQSGTFGYGIALTMNPEPVPYHAARDPKGAK